MCKGQMFVVGSAQGPIQHYFYTWLDQRFVSVTAAGVAKKIMLDQLIMSPICIVMFFATACMVEKQTFGDFQSELMSKFMTIYIVSIFNFSINILTTHTSLVLQT